MTRAAQVALMKKGKGKASPVRPEEPAPEPELETQEQQVAADDDSQQQQKVKKGMRRAGARTNAATSAKARRPVVGAVAARRAAKPASTFSGPGGCKLRVQPVAKLIRRYLVHMTDPGAKGKLRISSEAQQLVQHLTERHIERIFEMGALMAATHGRITVQQADLKFVLGNMKK